MQQLRIIERDFQMWGEDSLESLWDYSLENKYEGKKLKKELIAKVKSQYDMIRANPTSYHVKKPKVKPLKVKLQSEKKDSLGFGACPVASEKTRCCNLLTLDAVESCGFDCSYCSIQSFYNDSKVTFDSDFKSKLDALEIDPDEFYHIGTGQSSDSLMWGNKFEILDHLVDFAKTNPNIMLEFKTKSDNISYFLDKDIPKNIIFTWSLNPQVIIDNEEHITASLKQRLNSAKQIADLGYLVGFHFHPMIDIEDFETHYGEVFDMIKEMFDPKSVVMVSLGTLTFIKPVVKQIRNRDFNSKILQIPMVDASGKFSYPLETKIKMFKFAYESLKQWKDEVFFYLCMEDHTLWKDVFGFEYPTNESFEMAMKLSYMKKIRSVK